MLGALEELFLSEFFLNKAILRNHVDDNVLFSILADTYFIDSNVAQELKILLQMEEVVGVETEKDYMLYQREKKFLGDQINYDYRIDEIISIKENAIMTATEYALNYDIELTRISIFNLLTSVVNAGKIPALRLFGFYQCAGILVNQDTYAGIKTLKQCAKWGDIQSILLLIKYDTKEREINIGRLKFWVKGSPYIGFIDIVARAFGNCIIDSLENEKLMKKVFNTGIAQKDTFNSQIARIVYGGSIPLKDKSKIIFSGNKELMSQAGDLPLNMKNYNDSIIDLNFDALAVKRESEIQHLKHNIQDAFIHDDDNYKPLCICSDNKYFLNLYKGLFKGLGKEFNVAEFNVSELMPFDLEPTTSNIFFRKINEKKFNIFLLTFTGETDIETGNIAKTFLKANVRRNFRMMNPSVTIDISGILPICFCDFNNLKYFENLCDIVEVKDMDESEIPNICLDITNRVMSIYKCKIMNVNFLYKYFVSKSPDLINDVVYDIVKNSKGLKEIALTEENVIDIIKSKQKHSRYGFGGCSNEDQ